MCRLTVNRGIVRVNLARPDVTVIMVSYNTKDLTVRALETLFANAGAVTMRVVVWDNASADGSADAIARRFPQVDLIRSETNLGFGQPHNVIAQKVDSEWMLLLNSDTETHPRAVENLLAFARSRPDAAIFGGRTVFPDGSLNATSCWNRMTPWSLFCQAVGLARTFPRSLLFNPEGIGGWQRDTVRQVDLVTGCLFMLKTALWHELGGFNPRYFMYGEETDMCLRAAKRGYRLMITPDAQIMHLGGASTAKRAHKLVQLMQAKVTLIADHWSRPLVPLGHGLLLLNAGLRALAERVLGRRDGAWSEVWARRAHWLAGY